VSDRDRQLGLMGEVLQSTIFNSAAISRPVDSFKMYIAKEYTYTKAKRPNA
jgi:hypothetical protein